MIGLSSEKSYLLIVLEKNALKKLLIFAYYDVIMYYVTCNKLNNIIQPLYQQFENDLALQMLLHLGLNNRMFARFKKYTF